MRKLLPIILLAAAIAGGVYVGCRKGARRPVLRESALVADFLDAKFGNAIVLTTPDGGSVVIDPGPEETAGRLVDYLRDKGTQWIKLIVTYPSREHVGAAKRLIESFPVKLILRGERTGLSRTWDRALEAAAEAGIPELILSAGDAIRLSTRAKLEVLNPPPGFAQQADTVSENGSLVARVSVGRVRFLLTSHIGTEVEGRLIRSGADLRSDVLLVPRHGARGGTSLEFVSQVRPECIVVSVGKGADRPSAAVIRRVSTRNTGARLCRTDQDGPVKILTDGRSIEVLAGGSRQ